MTVSARTPISRLNEAMDLDIPVDQGFGTLGGYVAHTLGRIPRAGEVLSTPGFDIEILEADERRLHTARVVKKTPAEPAAPAIGEADDE